MTENAKNSGAQNIIQDPPEYNAENDKQPNAAYPTSRAGRMGTGNIAGVASTSTNEAYQTQSHSIGYKDQLGSADWLGGPQNGDETPGKSTEGAYQQNGQSWLGGPQNGDETPGEAARNPQAGDIQKPTEAGAHVQGVATQTGSQAKGMGSDGYTKHRFDETPGGNAGNGGNGGSASGSGNGGNG